MVSSNLGQLTPPVSCVMTSLDEKTLAGTNGKGSSRGSTLLSLKVDETIGNPYLSYLLFKRGVYIEAIFTYLSI